MFGRRKRSRSTSHRQVRFQQRSTIKSIRDGIHLALYAMRTLIHE
jgi:hypothetical protein